MAYVNLYNSTTNGYTRRLARIDSFTYVLGWSGQQQPYLAKLENDGTLVWQKRYDFSGVDNGAWVWYKSHFTDIMEISATGNLILLVSDQSNFLVVKLNSDGNVIWVKKHYDKSDTPLAYNGLSATARLFKLNKGSIVLKITENHSQNGGVRRIDHRFYRIDPENGVIITSRRIISENPILIVRDEEVRNEELVMFGYRDGKAIILTIDASLNLIQSSALYYNGELQGFNYLHIYAVSPVRNGRYSVLGSFYHYDPDGGSEKDLLDFVANDQRDDRIFRSVLEHLQEYTKPLPSRFTRFFTAEISEDHRSVNNERLLEKDFTATYQTVHKNAQGLFFSVYHQLYKCNSGLTGTDWVKKIQVPELS